MKYKDFIKLAKEGINFKELTNIEAPDKKVKGVYKILNLDTNKFYIGSSIDIYGRWKGHLYTLRNKKHRNPYLQRSYEKHGEDKFIFYLIENLTYKKHKGITINEFVRQREQYYLDTLKPYKGNGYNISVNAKVPSHGHYGLFEIQNGISKFSLEEINKIIKELEKGEKSRRQIAKEYDISRHTLKNIERRNFLADMTKGKKFPNRESKADYLKREKREDIIKAFKDGKTKKEISDEYSVGFSTINSVLANFKNDGKAKEVYQYDERGYFLKKFPSVSQAFKETGVDRKYICGACKLYGSISMGFMWSYTSYPEFTKEELIIGHRITRGKPRAIIKLNERGEILCCYSDFHILTEKESFSGRHLVGELNKNKDKEMIKYKNGYWKFLYQATEEEFDYLLNNKDKFISE